MASERVGLHGPHKALAPALAPALDGEAAAGSAMREEVERFDALAAEWWDLAGPMRPLHRMNGLRVGWIDRRVRSRFGGTARLLDIGCGAGIAAEALALAGHDVLGVDAAPGPIQAARAHAASRAGGEALPLRYRVGTAEMLADEGERFDVITALEVIEHVRDPVAFVATLSTLLRPGGLVFVSTLNRTPRAFALAKVGAEYVMRLLPMGTHDWRRFVRPAELAEAAALAGLRLADSAGMVMEATTGRWRESRDQRVNYIAMLAG